MSHYSDRHDHRHRRGGRTKRVIGTLVSLAVIGGAGYWGYGQWFDESSDSDVVAATAHMQKFLDAWASNQPGPAGKLTDSPENAESLIASVMKNLHPEKATITARRDDASKESAGKVTVPFTVDMSIKSAGRLTYDSEAKVIKKGDTGWKVEFSTPIVHPDMTPGQTLALESGSGRGKILDKNGNDLEAASIAGTVDETGKGISGLQARYNKELSGGATHSQSVVVVDRESGETVQQVTKTTGSGKGEDIKTTIDPKVQQAAAAALEGMEKKASIVAIDPTTGNILAAANRPGGMNRALEGRYPPGSTFKVVTSAALLKSGLKPGDEATCPKFAHVNGQKFENQNQFVLPEGSTFRDSFAKSCNTFFVNARQKVSGQALHQAAEWFGIGSTWDIGAVSYDGSVPVPASDNELAASTIGQAKVQASPLVMASIAATVKKGSFTQPVLVPDHVKAKHTAPQIDSGVVQSLREMMRATVTYGAGHALKDIPGAHAKTGTAEFGEAKPPQTHAWMIGYQEDRDVAWSVLIEDGGSGGKDAGPVAARFLKGLR